MGSRLSYRRAGCRSRDGAQVQMQVRKRTRVSSIARLGSRAGWSVGDAVRGKYAIDRRSRGFRAFERRAPPTQRSLLGASPRTPPTLAREIALARDSDRRPG